MPRRAAGRRAGHRPAAALDRLRHQLRDAARLCRQRLSGPIATCSARPKACGSRRRSIISPRDWRSPTRASPSAPTSASPTGGCPGRTAAPPPRRCARCCRPTTATPSRSPPVSTASSRRSGRCAPDLPPRLHTSSAISTGIWSSYRLLGVPASVLMNKANSDVDPTQRLPPPARRRALRRCRPQQRLLLHPPSDRRAATSTWASPAAACWRCAPRSAPSPPSTSPTSRRTSCSMPAAAARCAASSIRARARATPSTIRWAAPASSRRASSSASASANPSARWPSSMPAAPIPACCPTSRSSRRASAPASACATTPSFGPVRLDVGFPLNRRAGDPPFGIYVSLGQAF